MRIILFITMLFKFIRLSYVFTIFMMINLLSWTLREEEKKMLKCLGLELCVYV